MALPGAVRREMTAASGLPIGEAITLDRIVADALARSPDTRIPERIGGPEAPIDMRTSPGLRTRAFFVTFRAWNHGHLFGRIANGKMRRNPVGQEVASNWNQIPARFSNVVLDTFVVMPDHMHAILLMTDRGSQDAAPLPAILDFFQSSSSQSVDCGIWRGNGRKHVIRDRDELDRIRRYIRLNPQRWPRQPADLASFGRD